jgi:hypothetical protein
MKAYLLTTGILFGLLSVLHVWRAIAEWPRPVVDPGFMLQIIVTIVLPGVLSCWAWRLLRNLPNNPTSPPAPSPGGDE